MTCALIVVDFKVGDICRICLKKEDEQHNIFISPEDGMPTYAEMITTLGNMPVDKNDELPFHICNDCKYKLELCYKFRQNIIRNYEILRRASSTMEADNSINYETDCSSSCVSPKESIEESKVFDDSKPKQKLKASCANRRAVNFQKLNRSQGKCPLCLMLINGGTTLMDHFYSHYDKSGLEPLIVNGKKINTCNLCNKTMRYATTVIHHRIHLKIHPFKCDFAGCNREYACRQYLSTHMNIHYGLKKFQCQQCGKVFGLQSSLKNHEETHITEKAQCKVCNKSYKNSVMLKIHMKRHSVELKFKCNHPDCNKAFYNSHGLKRHELTHSLIKSHICSQCGKGWHSQGELERHKKRHLAIKQHQCSECLKSFTEKSALRIHEMTHTNERPYVCEFCSTGFVLRYKLKRHQIKSCKGIKKLNC